MGQGSWVWGSFRGLVRIGTPGNPYKIAKALEPKDWGECVGSVQSAEKSANFARLGVGAVEGILPVPPHQAQGEA